jgi:hypothetical protein
MRTVKIGKNERFTYEGVEILRCRIYLEYPDGKNEIAEFYEKCAENVYEYVKNELLPMATETYKADTDERKRFRFAPFRYQLMGTVTLDKEYFSQRLDVRLSRNGETLDSFTDGQIFDTERELLVPKNVILRNFGFFRDKRVKDTQSVLLFSDGIAVLKKGIWEKIKYTREYYAPYR